MKLAVENNIIDPRHVNARVKNNVHRNGVFVHFCSKLFTDLGFHGG
jgi:hypothetical protein